MNPTTETAIESSGIPFRLALLPMQDGDFSIVYWNPELKLWVLIQPVVVATIDDHPNLNLIHLAPVNTFTPDDLVERFRQQLGINDEDGEGK